MPARSRECKASCRWFTVRKSGGFAPVAAFGLICDMTSRPSSKCPPSVPFPFSYAEESTSAPDQIPHSHCIPEFQIENRASGGPCEGRKIGDSALGPSLVMRAKRVRAGSACDGASKGPASDTRGGGGGSEAAFWIARGSARAEASAEFAGGSI